MKGEKTGNQSGLGAVYGITKERIRQLERGVKAKTNNYLQTSLPERGPDV